MSWTRTRSPEASTAETLAPDVDISSTLRSLMWQDWEGRALVYKYLFNAAVSPDADPGRKLEGPIMPKFEELIGVTGELLIEVDEQLHHGHLSSGGYMERGDYSSLRATLLKTDKTNETNFYTLKQTYRDWLAEIGDKCLEADGLTSQLPLGSLDLPPYRYQESSISCSLASFRMVYEGIVGGPEVPEFYFNRLLSRRFKTTIVDSDFYSGYFTTQAFKNIYGLEVHPLTVKGASLASINKIASGMKSRRPEAKVFCHVPVQSEVAEAIWHSVVLLADDSEFVYCHNPKREHGGPVQPIPKEEFYRRWANCFNIAHIFISTDI